MVSCFQLHTNAMPQLQQFAQKAVIEKDGKILVIEHTAETKLTGGLYAFPGGRMNFGEEIDDHLQREVWEETNLEIIPLEPIHVVQWQIRKGGADIRESESFDLQIVALYRRAQYKSGEPSTQNCEDSDGIANILWLTPVEILASGRLKPNEIPVLQKYLLLRS